MAYHGHRVKVHDVDLNALNSAYLRIEEDKKNLREEGLLAHKNFVVREKNTSKRCLYYHIGKY